jgi:hypothetical protein
MNDKLDALLTKLKLLEDELRVEIHAKEKQFSYTVHNGKVHFTEKVSHAHQLLAKKLSRYWRDARWSSFFTTPVILSCIIPAAMMDFWAPLINSFVFPPTAFPKSADAITSFWIATIFATSTRWND